MRTTALFMALVFLAACNCPECPPPESCETLVCPSGYTLEKDSLKWECIPPVEPNVPVPEDYVSMNRVGTCEDIDNLNCTPGLLFDLLVNLQFNTWAGWRDPQYVAIYCSSMCQETLGKSPQELLKFGEEGSLLGTEGEGFATRFQEPNRYGFEGKTNVRKTAWKAYNDRLQAHLVEAYRQRDLAQQDPIRATCAYDSTRGWCTCRNGR